MTNNQEQSESDFCLVSEEEAQTAGIAVNEDELADMERLAQEDEDLDPSAKLLFDWNDTQHHTFMGALYAKIKLDEST